MVSFMQLSYIGIDPILYFPQILYLIRKMKFPEYFSIINIIKLQNALLSCKAELSFSLDYKIEAEAYIWAPL